MIALLCFILGIWLWDSYFGENRGYAPGTEEITLIRLDRNLQLAEAMEKDPPLLRWLAHGHSPEEAVADGIRSLELLISAQTLGPTGFRAYVALLATRDGAPVESYLSQLNIPSDDTESPNWWNIKIASEGFVFPQTATTQTIRNRAVFTGTIIWGLGITGLVFVPRALRCLRYAFRNKTRGYASGWNPSLGLTIFLLATLAWIGFTMVLELGIAQLPGLHPVGLILLDTFARILPTLIALGLLFRKASHVPRAIGLNGHIHPPVLLGRFFTARGDRPVPALGAGELYHGRPDRRAFLRGLGDFRTGVPDRFRMPGRAACGGNPLPWNPLPLACEQDRSACRSGDFLRCFRLAPFL